MSVENPQRLSCCEELTGWKWQGKLWLLAHRDMQPAGILELHTPYSTKQWLWLTFSLHRRLLPPGYEITFSWDLLEFWCILLVRWIIHSRNDRQSPTSAGHPVADEAISWSGSSNSFWQGWFGHMHDECYNPWIHSWIKWGWNIISTTANSTFPAIFSSDFCQEVMWINEALLNTA